MNGKRNKLKGRKKSQGFQSLRREKVFFPKKNEDLKCSIIQKRMALTFSHLAYDTV